MNKEKLKTRYLITSERAMNHPGNRIAGSAYQTDGEDHMTIHLRFLPGITFFLKRNATGFPEFIVYSGRSRREDRSYRFFHRIGSGHTLEKDEKIQVHLPDFSISYFIQLKPVDFHDVMSAA